MDIKSLQVIGNVDESVLINATFDPEVAAQALEGAYFQAAVTMGIDPASTQDLKAAVIEQSSAEDPEKIVENVCLSGLALAAADNSGVPFYGMPEIVNSSGLKAKDEDVTLLLSVHRTPEMELNSYDPVIAAIPKVDASKAKDETAFELASDQLEKTAVAESLAKRIVGDIPKSYIDWYAQDLVDHITQFMQSQGLTVQDYIQQAGLRGEAGFYDFVNKQAKSAASEAIALDALFKHQELEVSDEKLVETAKSVCGDVADPVAFAKSAGIFHQVLEAAQRIVALDYAMSVSEVRQLTPEEMDELTSQAKKEAKPGFDSDGIPKAGPLMMHNKGIADALDSIVEERN